MFHDEEKVLSFLTKDIEQCGMIVLGDIMLDKYYFGDVSRISPEAPVPVAKVKKEKTTLGGAANVAHNLARVGAKVYLAGITGQDENRSQLIGLLTGLGIDYSGLIATDRPTITKLRVIGGHQQMVRLDFEEVYPLENTEAARLKAWLHDKIAEGGIHGVVISDYAKGVCTPAFVQAVIEQCKKANIPVFVDPKGLDWNKYRGADFVTPNIKELGEAVGSVLVNQDKEVELVSQKIRAQYSMENVVATRSEKGLSVINGQQVLHIPTQAEEVFDVSGAGDTVAAVLAAGIAGGLDTIDAAHLANMAAGIVVGKMGTYAISRQELLTALQQQEGKSGCRRKILGSFAEAVNVVNAWRSEGAKIVFTNGCFDILHAGHVIYLEKARRLGDRLILGLNSDASVRRLKGEERPVVGQEDRARVMAALECIDGVILFDEDTPAKIINLLKPDILVKGGDYTPDAVVGREDAGRLEIIPFEQGKSTTGIIERIIEIYEGGREK